MASHKAKAAHRGDGGDLRKQTSRQEDVSKHIDRADWPQDRIIAQIEKHRRARIEVALHTYDGGVRRVDLRLREHNGLGVFRTSGPRIAISPAKLRSVIEALQDAEIACIEEGLL
jgi:hypothetical protein